MVITLNNSKKLLIEDDPRINAHKIKPNIIKNIKVFVMPIRHWILKYKYKNIFIKFIMTLYNKYKKEKIL